MDTLYYMKNTTPTIGVRELTRNLKKITTRVQRGATIVVQKNNTPLFRITPLTESPQTIPLTLKDIEKIQFSGSTHASSNVDNIVYGI